MAGKMMRRGFLIGMLALIGVAGYYLYPILKAKFFNDSENIMAIGEDEEAPLFIKTGSTAQDVANQMVEEGIIKSDKRDLFLNKASSKNYGGSKVVPGFYMVKGSWHVDSLIIHLRGGYSRKEVTFKFNDCWTLGHVVGQVTRSLEIDSADFHDYIISDNILSKYGLSKETMITLFYPNQYRSNWAASKDDILGMMSKQYKSVWTADNKAKAQELGMTQSEVATLASIVYRETSTSTEWSRVAGLYINRIKKGMPLQADPTLKFASGRYDAQRVYNSDKVSSPYNTYENTGLPPGPISAVPKGVIPAVLNYESHDYIFMCAKPNNEKGHNFAETLSEHNRNAAKYRAWLNQNNIK